MQDDGAENSASCCLPLALQTIEGQATPGCKFGFFILSKFCLRAAPPNEECVPWFMLMALPRVGPEEAAAGAEEGQEFLNDVGRKERVSGSGRFLEEGRKHFSQAAPPRMLLC